MTAMLERAAMAACDYISSNDPEFMAWEKLSDENKREYEGLVRAVLMAVREPDDAVVVVGELAAWDAPNSMPSIRAMSRGFTAMIDAVLAGDA